MFVQELVQSHGLGITVSCGRTGYPPFTVFEQKGEKAFTCKYPDGTTFELDDCLDDYELVLSTPSPQ